MFGYLLAEVCTTWLVSTTVKDDMEIAFYLGNIQGYKITKGIDMGQTSHPSLAFLNQR